MSKTSDRKGSHTSSITNCIEIEKFLGGIRNCYRLTDPNRIQQKSFGLGKLLSALVKKRGILRDRKLARRALRASQHAFFNQPVQLNYVIVRTSTKR